MVKIKVDPLVNRVAQLNYCLEIRNIVFDIIAPVYMIVLIRFVAHAYTKFTERQLHANMIFTNNVSVNDLGI